MAAAVDRADSTLAAAQYNGLQTLDDYILLYNGHWKTTLPSGPVPGMLGNHTRDLLFSMERLSPSPYLTRRLNPSADTLQFNVDSGIAMKTSGMTLQQLLESGGLFCPDYRDRKDITPTD